MFGSNSWFNREPEWGIAADEPPTPASTALSAARTDLQRMLLLRLDRLTRLHALVTRGLPCAKWQERLVNKALFSTYEDCRAQGLESAARQLMREAAALPVDWALSLGP